VGKKKLMKMIHRIQGIEEEPRLKKEGQNNNMR
jgi:hypothetical protein